MQIVIAGPGVSPEATDIWIEPAGMRAAAIEAGALVLDPQHGGSANRGRLVPTYDRPYGSVGAAAVTAAYVYAEGEAHEEGCDQPPSDHRRIVLRADAGLDDFAAAALLTARWPPPGDQFARLRASFGQPATWYARSAAARPPSVFDPGLGVGVAYERICQLARADNASAEGLPDWEPGQKLRDVTNTFPGLSRLCACAALPVERRVELVAQWLLTGDLGTLEESHDDDYYLLGLADHQVGEPSDGLLATLDRAARADLARGREAMRVRCHGPGSLVALVESQMRGLSLGRGALARGYEEAPVVIAVSELPGGNIAPGETLGAALRQQLGYEPPKLVTIAKATNARHVELDWTRLHDELCALELGWGGNPKSGILGSPKPAGTRLVVTAIVELVLRHISVVVR